MKQIYKSIGLVLLLGGVTLSVTSCKDDFLDRKPLSQVSPGDYFTQEGHIAAEANNFYSLLPSHGEGWNIGMGLWDNNTDNQAGTGSDENYYVPGIRKVPSSGGLGLGKIRDINYAINAVAPKVESGSIQGSKENINHYLGELYFFRGLIYFDKLQTYGDFPIITEVFEDNQEILVENAKRAPRNEVAKFILKDFDKAISLLKESGWNNQRITKKVAQLLKSRVALYEASWETYFQGTPFVPGDPEWPGAKATYNQGKTFNPKADIDFFLSEAMSAAKAVAEATPLTENSGKLQPDYGKVSGFNKYFEMFSDVDMSSYPEVLLWRQYSNEHGINNTINNNIKVGGNSGFTKGLVESFLMANGLPIYADNSGYAGDIKLNDVKKDRDGRLQLFMFGEWDILNPTLSPEDSLGHFIHPALFNIPETKDVTGYRSKKYLNYDPKYSPTGGGKVAINGSVTYRAAEAYLNYIEACYMKTGIIDQTADKYWKAIRTRAKVNPDYKKTIAATVMAKEALGDWGAYSGGKLIDETLYNIRRERRSELVSEGLRMMDLKRWRALDQVKNYIIEGFNFWDNFDEYNKFYSSVNEKTGKIEYSIKEGESVSKRSDGKYLRPYRIIEKNNNLYNGYTWSMANYLSPVSYREMELNSPDGKAENSNFYQNPYWPVEANGAAIK